MPTSNIYTDIITIISKQCEYFNIYCFEKKTDIISFVQSLT